MTGLHHQAHFSRLNPALSHAVNHVAARAFDIHLCLGWHETSVQWHGLASDSKTFHFLQKVLVPFAGILSGSALTTKRKVGRRMVIRQECACCSLLISRHGKPLP